MAGEVQKLALVTGASRGIGRASALELARRGYHIIALARAVAALESLDDEIRAAGGGATLTPLDIKDFDGLDRLGGVMFERWGRLDALVSCAGVLGVLTPLAHARPSMMQEAFAVNVLAAQRLIRSMDPLLRAAGGSALFVTSRAGRNPRAHWGAYAASKAALDALVRCYAQESAVARLRVRLFDPGPVRTALRAKAYPGEDPQSLIGPEALAPALVDVLEMPFGTDQDVLSVFAGA
jgi:NAD(P)-dependent dehydrogenase (short-subunit alcohol dehydrogenase family)